MSPCVFITFSLLLLCLETTTANQLVPVGGREDSNGVGANKCLDEERHALLHFKAAFQDPDGSLSTWRAEEDDCCKWVGVTCNNQTGHVTQLELIFFGLVGEISHSLVNLSYLNHFDLSSNHFQGTIPTFIGSLTRLRYLDLSDNGFNGTIPKSIGFLTRLRHLGLGSNNLNGTIPRIIGSLTELSYLDLSSNSLYGTIPRTIGSLTKLRHLGLSSNSLYGTIPPEFGNLTNLQELYLGYAGRCRVENLEWLSHLSHLEGLSIGGISLAKQNHWVNVILSLQKLSDLSLEGCELSKVMYPYSSFLNSSSSSIDTLQLGNNNLTSSMYRWLLPLTSNKLSLLSLSSNMLDGIPKYLGNLCSFKSLYFHNNSATVRFPDFLNNLSGCASLTLQWLYAPRSQFTGSLSDDIQKFSSLEVLDLSDNQLSGTISDKLWELPMLKTLHVSFNNLRVSSTNHMSSLSYVQYTNLELSSCKLGPRFPKWIQTLKNLTYLGIANTSISDTVPVEFWDMWPSQLQYLNLSSNNISGKVLDLTSNFISYSVIDLSSNNFHGLIPNVSSTLISLNLSRNKFSGGIFFLCQMVDGFFQFLDLSHNSLSGQLPDCLWHFKELKVLNLGNNKLSGRLPPSIGSLNILKVLYLYNNNFSGELPLSLKNCTSLMSLNLGANKFSGNVPVWIGENFFELYVLILKSNKFFGTIPSRLCHLSHLQILDLSVNNLHGTIPSCLSNLTSMVQKGFSQEGDIDYRLTNTSVVYRELSSGTYVDHAMIQWQGDEREFIKHLRLLKIVDLSSNILTGKIPYEITKLSDLIVLNLSNNALLGEIPQQIGRMKNLLALDLSENNLSGRIPSSMTQMTFLGYLDVSSNHLSGRIPTSTQLQSFKPSRYDGNARLCGPPLTKNCPGDEDSKLPRIVGESEGDGEGVDELERWFYIGGGTGFLTGFWIACGTLLLNRHGRRAFFRFYDSSKDWVYVKVV